jgi:hypothetical protein
MLQASIIGSSSLNPSEVDAHGNVLVNLPTNPAYAGYTQPLNIITGTDSSVNLRLPNISVEGRQHVALDRPVLYINFAGSGTPANAIPQDALKQTATTMTASAGSTAGGFLWLNSGAITTTATGIAYQTYGTFPTFGGYGTRYEFQAMPINCNTAVNKVLELGAGLITDAKTDGLLDGFCFRWTKSGTFIGVISINGTEYQTSPLSVPSDNILHRFTINVNQLGCEFYVDQVLQTILTIPASAVGPGYNTNPPLLMRIYNAVAIPSLAPQVKISEIWISQAGIDWQKPWSHIVAGMSQHGANVPFGTAIGESAASFVNSVAYVVAGAATNTALVVGHAASLGGITQFVAQATNVAAAGDNIITSFQIPAQSATQASKRYVCTGVHITGMNNGAVVATTPTTLLWGVAWGHTAISLATGEGVAAKAPRHMKVGTQYFPIGAVIGQSANDINITFANPFVVNPGEYIASTCRFIMGTATASQYITASVTFEGYWE